MSNSYNNQPVSVFVSSTYEDLKPHREEVIWRLVGMSLIVKGMEFFGSSPNKSLDTCLEQLAECNLLILIVGARYGSIEKESKKSFTELEYEFALKHNIPVLAYLADMDSSTVGIPLSSADSKHAAKLEAFKKRLADDLHYYSFTSIDDLGKQIEHDVPSLLDKLANSRTADKAINYKLIVEENEQLKKRLKQKDELISKFWGLLDKHPKKITDKQVEKLAEEATKMSELSPKQYVYEILMLSSNLLHEDLQARVYNELAINSMMYFAEYKIRINRLVEKIAYEASVEGNSQPEQYSDALKAFAAELRKSSSKTPNNKMRTVYDNIIKAYPLAKASMTLFFFSYIAAISVSKTT